MNRTIIISVFLVIILAVILVAGFFVFGGRKQVDDFKKGEIYYREGELKKTYDCFMMILKRYPKSPQVNEIIGRVLYQRGMFKESIKYYEKAIELDPKNVIFLANSFLPYYINGRLDDAQHVCERILELSPELRIWNTVLADVYLRKSFRDERYFQKAEEYINKGALSEGETHFIMGKIQFIKDRNREAIQNIELAMKKGHMEPDDELDMMLFLGELYLRCGEPEKAKKTFFHLIDLFDAWKVTHWGKTMPYPEGAMTILSVYFGERFERARFEQLYSRFDFQTKNGVRAYPAFRQISKILFFLVDAKQKKDYGRALLLARMLSYELSQIFKKKDSMAISVVPGLPSCTTSEIIEPAIYPPLFHIYIGDIYREMGKRDEARNEYNKALELDRENCITKGRLESL